MNIQWFSDFFHDGQMEVSEHQQLQWPWLPLFLLKKKGGKN